MAEVFLFGLPMTACVVGLVWLEVARVRALKAIGLAAIEAEKQVKIAEAQARADTATSGAAGREEGGRG